MLDFRIQVFNSVARHLSYTKASQELYISQPAVTKHIQELESELRLKLFNRIGNRIVLTEAGTLFLSYTARIAALHQEALFELSGFIGKPEGTLRLGASTTIAQYLIPVLLAKFHELYPGIQVILVNGNTEIIEKKIFTDEIDMGIVEGQPTHQNIHYIPFLADELIIFTSSQNNKISALLSIDQFKELPLVLRERGSGTLEIIEKTIQPFGFKLNSLSIIMFLGSTEAIKTYVTTGHGAGIVSHYAIDREIKAGLFRTLQVPGLTFERNFHLIHAEGPVPGGPSKLFINFLHQQYNF